MRSTFYEEPSEHSKGEKEWELPLICRVKEWEGQEAGVSRKESCVWKCVLIPSPTGKKWLERRCGQEAWDGVNLWVSSRDYITWTLGWPQLMPCNSARPRDTWEGRYLTLIPMLSRFVWGNSSENGQWTPPLQRASRVTLEQGCLFKH